MSLLESWKNIPNTIVNIPSWGTVELKYISTGDMERFASFLRDTTSSREFVASCLLNQIVSPSVNLQNVIELPDVEMEDLARALIKSDRHIYSYFAETGDFFGDFRQAIESSITETTNVLMGMVRQSMWFPVEDILKNIPLFNWPPEVLIHDINASIRSQLDQAQINIPQTPIINSIVLQGFSEQLASTAASLVEMQSVIAHALQDVISANHHILESARQYWKLFIHRELTEAKAAHVLKKYGWLISPSLPNDMVSRVVELSEDDRDRYKAINSLFYDHFRINKWYALKEMVCSWKNSPISRSRFKILHDCMYAVIVLSGSKANPANVIIPTLMAQIDGITSELLKKQGIEWDVDYAENFKRGKDLKVGRITQYKNARVPVLSPELDDLTDSLLFEFFFCNTKHKKLDKLHALNRHQLMHGADNRYGRRDYMLRAFLILDSLIHLLQLVVPKPATPEADIEAGS